jgi:hypothetical protein
MKVWLWMVVALVGLGLMVAAYAQRPRPEPGVPWAQGLIVVGHQDQPPAGPLPVRRLKSRLRLLPGDQRSELILKILEESAQPNIDTLGLALQLRPKLLALAPAEAGIGSRLLVSGRLPQSGRDEVLAGARLPGRRKIAVGDRTLEVAGVLEPSVALFADSYLVAPDAPEALFPEGDRAVHDAVLIELTAEQALDRKVVRQIEAAYPAPKFHRYMPMDRLGRGPYYLYLTGQALFLLGGSGVIIALYGWLAGRIGWRPLAAPLQEIVRRRRLYWAAHVVYFGLVIAGALIIYELPEVQSVMMTAVRAQITAPSGPLGAAGRAYGSGSIPRAAAVTFAVNFFLGSLAVISLPSIVVPGVGIFIAMLRAVSWGLLLGPTFVQTALGMIPHSGTMLVEGEGYILAAFFALLIPIYLIDSSQGKSLLSRFGRVLLLNLQANAWVAIVLIAAACYEATELILLNR